MCPCSKAAQQPPRLHWKEHCQPGEGGDSSTLLRDATQVLGPVLGSPVQYRNGHTRVNPVKGHKRD